MRYTWDEHKRQANLEKHGLDFADAHKVFSGHLVLFGDNRRGYGEQRMIAIGQPVGWGEPANPNNGQRLASMLGFVPHPNLRR